MSDGFVTKEECKDFRDDIYKRLGKTEEDVIDLKLVLAKFTTEVSGIKALLMCIFASTCAGVAGLIFSLFQ